MIYSRKFLTNSSHGWHVATPLRKHSLLRFVSPLSGGKYFVPGDDTMHSLSTLVLLR